MNTNLCQMHEYTQFGYLRNSGFLQAGRRTLHFSVEFASDTQTDQRTGIMTFTATRRDERCLGFAVEALKITFFPFILTLKAIDRLARVNLFCAIVCLPLAFAAGFLLAPYLYIVPLVLAAAAIFELVRIAHYARTHTTIQEGGRKYYVHIPTYRRELQNAFQIEARNLPSRVYKNPQTLMNQFQRQQLVPTQRTVDRLKTSVLNLQLSRAFERKEYEQVIKFIHWAANPNLIFSVTLEENPREFGCLFALVSKRLQNDKENEHLKALYDLLRTRIPEDLQLTHLLEEIDKSLLSKAKEQITADEFTLEKAHLWAKDADAHQLYAIATKERSADLQKIYLKSDNVNPSDLLRNGNLVQYKIGTGSALAHDRFPDDFPAGGQITIYRPQEVNCEKRLILRRMDRTS